MPLDQENDFRRIIQDSRCVSLQAGERLKRFVSH